jgi:hypothetical protein
VSTFDAELQHARNENQAAPVEPTFTRQRDAILAAVEAMARDDASAGVMSKPSRKASQTRPRQRGNSLIGAGSASE